MMLIRNGICEYVRKYAVLNKNICHFLGPSPSVLSVKNLKHGNVYKLMQCCALDFFPKTRSLTGPCFGFFRIHEQGLNDGVIS